MSTPSLRFVRALLPPRRYFSALLVPLAVGCLALLATLQSAEPKGKSTGKTSAAKDKPPAASLYAQKEKQKDGDDLLTDDKPAAAPAKPAAGDDLLGDEKKPEAPSSSPAATPDAKGDDLLTEEKKPAAAPAASSDDLLTDDKKPAAATPGAKADDELLLPAPGAPGAIVDELLVGMDTATPVPKPASKADDLPPAKKQPVNPVDPHALVLAKSSYPSASECAVCHTAIYNEWRSSNHAYASLSPVFHKFEQKLTNLAQGTLGYFCMRCHGGVGTTLKEDRSLPIWKRVDVSREGVTCITCHRVSEQYTRVNGERRIEPGNIYAPVYGSFDGRGVAKVLSKKDEYHVKTSDNEPGPGVSIHLSAFQTTHIADSEFCISCHQVAVHPGIKLEVVWEQYRSSPSLLKGTKCQECHMGKVPGRPEGYTKGPAAIVGGIEVNPERRHSNHNFYGPGYPIAHPGIFPHNPAATKFSIQTWLKFDFRAKWGTEAFEKKVAQNPKSYKFPEEWDSAVDRSDARIIIDDNLAMLEQKRKLREKVMANGSKLDGPFFSSNPTAGSSLRFKYTLHNVNPGHNMPSGSLGAQPEIWLNVALFDPTGRNVWESGYVDSFGDMADLHSRDVRSGKIRADQQLFNLQTKFLTTNVKGTDREMYLPVNLDFDQLPFIRPAGVPTTVLNHPPFVRMEGRSMPPLSSRDASYSVPASALKMPGKYRLSARLRSRAEPVYFMDFVEATPEMDQAMNEWMIEIHPYSVEFQVAPKH